MVSFDKQPMVRKLFYLIFTLRKVSYFTSFDEHIFRLLGWRLLVRLTKCYVYLLHCRWAEPQQELGTPRAEKRIGYHCQKKWWTKMWLASQRVWRESSPTIKSSSGRNRIRSFPKSGSVMGSGDFCWILTLKPPPNLRFLYRVSICILYGIVKDFNSARDQCEGLFYEFMRNQ